MGTGHEESEEEKTQRNTAKSRTRNGGREETAEYRREQNRNGGIPPNAGQNRRNTGESRIKRKKNGWQKKSKITRTDTPIVRHGRIIVNLLYTC